MAVNRMPLRRRMAWSLGVLLILLILLEGTARIVDSRVGFRRQVLKAYRLMEIRTEPIGVPESPVPRGADLMVRGPADSPPLDRPWTICGRIIPDVRPPGPPVAIRPEQAREFSERQIFVVGGSAAYGFPYAYRDTFTSILVDRLRQRGFWAFNASIEGGAAGELVPVAARIVDEYDVDTLVIYSGNNEWYHWLPESQSRVSPGRLRLLRTLARSRAAAAVEYWVMRRAAARARVPSEDGGFVQHAEFEGASYALEHPAEDYGFDPGQWLETKKRFLENFEAALALMIDRAREKGVRVVILTVPFNYRLSPSWKHPQPESFDPAHREAVREAIREAARLIGERSHGEALRRIETALALDPLPPVLHYLKARCLEAAGRRDEAESAYAECRENMVGNLGGVLSINRVIARVARDHGAELIDVRRVFDDDEHARGSHFNRDLIHDDCHPTPRGHALIAEELIRLIDR